MMEVKEGFGKVEEKSEAVKKDGTDKYWRYKIALNDGEVLTFSQWKYDEGKEIHLGDEVKLFWTEKEGQGVHGPVTYRNINSIGPTEAYKANAEPVISKKSDKELANEAPKSTILHKENGGGVGEPLTINQSIVRQVMYKIAAEANVKGIPAKDLITYARELEKGFYEVEK